MKMTFTRAGKDPCPVDFKISGYSYKRRKESARSLGIEIASVLSECVLSYSEIITIQETMKKIGLKFGLLSEFRESGIC